MDLHLKNKVFIVTGGGAGIGGAISLLLAQEGATVAIFGRSALSSEFEASLQETQTNYSFHQLDLTDEKACQENVQKVIDLYGRLDGLVNNAGINDNVGLEDSIDAFRQSLDKNLIHYFTMAHFCIPHLKQSKGSIVNIGSKVAVTGQGHTSGYAAANGGRLALTREWAAQFKDDGVRVNAVLPAEVMTPLYQRWVDSFDNPTQKLAQITQNIPFGHRMTTTHEIANTTVFLLSDRSSHTTGQLLYVDGGYTHLDRALDQD
ncbi:SDR family oxidoreductase [Acinetobacter bereziniae]|uniref:SDR family oxidoreductase n=1 Tax=Acinetobacter bereziniae TaxID=106648 RepID=UPI000EF69270|nr:SDR family oxidoreductase [Acinetobacter bereziniae]MCU4475370.1 SDR family oxidoreductase [Acinetobacter bereziniae]MCU4539690.1 SDR family oxidoreductase [Acinetobacter bereziniae]MCU4624131.1 SDR family oxidoreductase [Acinetobacter bereziniae]MDQ9821294.1 SDR family oxidoreductase [Acinetobacter bereziniae]